MEENKELLTRIAICVVAAFIVYYAGDRISDQFHFSFLDKSKPWLAENKIQVVAVVAAILFGISMAAFPLPSEQTAEEPDF